MAGVERAVVNVHHFADQIEAHLKTRKEPAMTISDERGAILENGRRRAQGASGSRRRPFIAHNSDFVWIEDARSNLGLLMDAWAPRGWMGFCCWPAAT